MGGVAQGPEEDAEEKEVGPEDVAEGLGVVEGGTGRPNMRRRRQATSVIWRGGGASRWRGRAGRG